MFLWTFSDDFLVKILETIFMLNLSQSKVRMIEIQCKWFMYKRTD